MSNCSPSCAWWCVCTLKNKKQNTMKKILTNKKMRRIGPLLTLIFFLTDTFGQGRGRWDRGGERYDGPLPSGNEVVEYFLYAVGFVVGAIILVKVSELFTDGDKETAASNAGSGFASLFLLAAIFCLIPLIMWVEVIVNSLITIFTIVVVGFAIIMLIGSLIKK